MHQEHDEDDKDDDADDVADGDGDDDDDDDADIGLHELKSSYFYIDRVILCPIKLRPSSDR